MRKAEIAFSKPGRYRKRLPPGEFVVFVNVLRKVLGAVFVVWVFGPAAMLQSQSAAPARPRITGISHVGYFVSDLPRSLAFWHDLLGFEQSGEVVKESGHGISIVVIEINAHQHVELFNEPPVNPPNMMSHLCFTVDDLDAMRGYLESRGVEVSSLGGPERRLDGRSGQRGFMVKDPDGTVVEFEKEHGPGELREPANKAGGESRISEKIFHVGFLVGNSQRSLAFYGGLLGFEETWRGGPDPKELSWINMRVPDGTDYIEFMLYRDRPDNFGGRNHVSLEVPDVARSVSILESRPASKSYGKPVKVAIGINRKRQVNLFDPDGTRVELMEPKTTTGEPTPSSTAPPPPPAHD